MTCSEVNEGYGQTENAGTAVKCVDGDHAPDGSVGPPTAGVEVKLVDVPEVRLPTTVLSCRSLTPDARRWDTSAPTSLSRVERCALAASTSCRLVRPSIHDSQRRADTVFDDADYKDEAKTAETIDSDGWLHSGDIASVDAIGRFKIIDRIKNLVKLSQGEYVALEKVRSVARAVRRAGC